MRDSLYGGTPQFLPILIRVDCWTLERKTNSLRWTNRFNWWNWLVQYISLSVPLLANSFYDSLQFSAIKPVWPLLMDAMHFIVCQSKNLSFICRGSTISLGSSHQRWWCTWINCYYCRQGYRPFQLLSLLHKSAATINITCSNQKQGDNYFLIFYHRHCCGCFLSPFVRCACWASRCRRFLEWTSVPITASSSRSASFVGANV